MSSDSDTNKPVFTARETELLAHAMKCTKGEVTVDYGLLADVAGFKSKDSARVAWYNIRKKLDLVSGTSTGKTSGSPSKADRAEHTTPKKIKGESKKRKPSNNDESELETSVSPSKPSPSKVQKLESKVKKDAKPKAQDRDDAKAQSENDSDEDNIRVATPASKSKGNAGKKRGAAKSKANSKAANEAM